MEQTFALSQTENKELAYKEFMKYYEAFVEDEDDVVSVMANTSAALKEAFGFFWVGFYIRRGDTLRLGPFQGNVACYRIPEGKGVCGTAMKEKRTVVVPDVELFPGHIACSSLSRSEIVVPVYDSRQQVAAVLDIDSDEVGTFDGTDAIYLEKVAEVVARLFQ